MIRASEHPEGLRLECDGGSVWVTPQADGRMHVHSFSASPHAAVELAGEVCRRAAVGGWEMLATVEVGSRRLRKFYRRLGFRNRYVTMEKQ